MWVRSLRLENIRCFDQTDDIEFSSGINLLVGPNNAGKSTILLPLLSLQDGLPRLSKDDVRSGSGAGLAEVQLADLHEQVVPNQKGTMYVRLDLPKSGQISYRAGPRKQEDLKPFPPFTGREPKNFIYPFLSQRKSKDLTDTVGEDASFTVLRTLENLNAQIDRLVTRPQSRPHEWFLNACKNILMLTICTAPQKGGKRAVYVVRDTQPEPEYIRLEAMGAGVTNILGLLVYLARVTDHLFVLEEPENDIHPRALKALLDCVAEKSKDNQFIITTHSNIVLKKLGDLRGSKVFHVACRLVAHVHTSTVHEIVSSPEDRKGVLKGLGYELHDLDVWDAWLILEESSAEKIIRNHLIRWFVPSLEGHLRPYSAHSLSEVTGKVIAFNDLFVFIHLEPVYKNRAWVVVDAGDEELKVVEALQARYRHSGWKSNHFRQFKEHDFERYYPDGFSHQVEVALNTKDKQKRKKAKKDLLAQVEVWIKEDDSVAKKAFAESAAEVVGILKEIAHELDLPGTTPPPLLTDSEAQQPTRDE